MWKRIGKARFFFTTIVVLCGILLVGAGQIYAQDLGLENPEIEWTWVGGSIQWQGTYNFGHVALGESKTAQFKLTSPGETSVWIYVIGLSPIQNDAYTISPDSGDGYTLGAFSFNPATWVGAPRELLPGESFMVDITFTPMGLEAYSAYLNIMSNDTIDPPGEYAFLHLTGTGVSASVPEPATWLLIVSGLIGLAALKRKLHP